MMHGRRLVLAAFVAMLAVMAPASARTYDHGKTVWFDNAVIEDGDEVQGNLDVYFGSVTCNDGAHIDGDVRTFLGSFTALDGCEVDGRVINTLGEDAFVPWLGPVATDDFFAADHGFTKKLGWDVLVVLAFLLFPLRVRIALDRVEKHPGLCGVVGAIAAIAALPIVVLLLFSIIGIPLIPLELAVLFAGLCVGNAAVALLLGRRLYELLRPHFTPTPLGALILGLVMVTAAETLPTVGWAVTTLVFLVGLGAATLAFMRQDAFHWFGAIPRTGSPTPPSGSPMKRAAGAP